MPGSEQDGQKPEQWNKDVWHPLCTRVDFTCFTKSHKHDAIFPYSEKHLAYALALLCRWPALCDNLKPLDEEQPAEDCQDIEKWHKEQDERQQVAFKAALEKHGKTWPGENAAPDLVEAENEEVKSELSQGLD